MRLGGLFWKFFFAFWLALLLAGVGVGSAVWWHQQKERERIEADPSAPAYLVTACGVGYRFDPAGGGQEA